LVTPRLALNLVFNRVFEFIDENLSGVTASKCRFNPSDAGAGWGRGQAGRAALSRRAVAVNLRSGLVWPGPGAVPLHPLPGAIPSRWSGLSWLPRNIDGESLDAW
jgi:hypothetical protein